MNPKVSVCISVHNTEKFLPRCLDSVYNQTLDNIEIVLVNNGSSDSSLSIMEKYAAKYNRTPTKIISQEDRGLAQGRQSGVNYATGDYITFLDADDYVENETYEIMLNTALREGVDIVEIDTNHGEEVCSNINYDGLNKTSEILKAYFHGKILPMIWMRMYKRELFEKPVFPDLYINNEDLFAFPCLLSKANTIFIIHKPLHYYTINEGSFMVNMNRKDNTEKDYQRRLRNLQYIPFVRDYLTIEGVSKDIMQAFRNHSAKYLFSFINNRSSYHNYEEKIRDVLETLPFKRKSQLNSYIRKNILPDSVLRICIKLFGVSFTYKIITLLKYRKQL